ncbi:hypothetical protein HNR31_000529 [Anoxybacillus caldiproteolyticus]|uniref:Uncharacterized protein n=1 Tax=Thermaerobacillus caldiproteolyticus TaxID=247480 RepID=A0A7V9Z488_9BACL|nr:hypothetical protein [Anoxybacillus caldiproteolyticus]
MDLVTKIVVMYWPMEGVVHDVAVANSEPLVVIRSR